ncbi:MAG: hypothetical protein IPL59_24625 [Candidatus Competibacteraceae bacterium]|nr:hypothetical protein [Candidatus Competibacteraceae bacterium]
MLVHNFKTKEICALLDVSDSFVRKWGYWTFNGIPAF